ncbi:hypothetical protein PR048_030171 [Dryococelus australis]|uniref:Uncharacterized protein n=1 Tax=Dryococelus australis TaxID=614101 RepID=A0ABQ9GAY4_9NEOP|nr:hypothetical protein PR048_030171 [Dryococelus australis]
MEGRGKREIPEKTRRPRFPHRKSGSGLAGRHAFASFKDKLGVSLLDLHRCRDTVFCWSLLSLNDILQVKTTPVVPYWPAANQWSAEFTVYQPNVLSMLNFTVLSVLEPASFLHWLQHRYEATPFLTELHVVEHSRLIDEGKVRLGSVICGERHRYSPVGVQTTTELWSDIGVRPSESRTRLRHSIPARTEVGTSPDGHIAVAALAACDTGTLSQCSGHAQKSGEWGDKNEVLRADAGEGGEYGVASECKGGLNVRSSRNSADQGALPGAIPTPVTDLRPLTSVFTSFPIVSYARLPLAASFPAAASVATAAGSKRSGAPAIQYSVNKGGGGREALQH